MSLRERLNTIQTAQPAVQFPTEGADSAAYQALRASLQTQLLDRIDLEVMGRMSPDRLREELRILVERLIGESGAALNAGERKQIVTDIQNEIMGLGPIEPLLADETVSDILVNTYRHVYVER